nr:YiiX/YebB-like N1pC/P60 family cysteine hydrolase [Pseudomonas asplenii]
MKMPKKYIIDRSKLLPGDIVLTAEVAAVSKVVRLATFSRYSHAAIWVDGTMIEATQDGVFSKNIQRLILDKPGHADVYRSKDPLTRDQAIQICDYARSLVGTLYALDEAMLVLPKRKLGLAETKRQFCSRLVALSYEQSGFDLKNLRHPLFCTPRMLSVCTAFEKVPNMVREALAEEIAFAETDDPGKKNQAHLFEWLNAVRKLVKEDESLKSSYDIQAANDVDGLLIAHPHLDETITALIRSNEYLTFYNNDTKNEHLAYRYNKFAMIEKLSHYQNPGDFLMEELSKEPEMFRRFEIMTSEMIDKFDKTGLTYFYEHVNLYRNLMTGVYVRLKHIAIGYEWIGEDESAERVYVLASMAASVIRKAQVALGET